MCISYGLSESSRHRQYAIRRRTTRTGPTRTEIYPHNGLYWPEEHRNSDVMMFVTNRDGVWHQKDLGENTADQTKAVKAVVLDERWEPMEKLR